MPGWTLDKVVYVYDLQAEVKARTGYVREWQGMTPVYYYQQGEADLKYLTKNGLAAHSRRFAVNAIHKRMGRHGFCQWPIHL